MGKLPKEIILYGEGVPEEYIDALHSYLNDKLGYGTILRKGYIVYNERAPFVLASLRIRGPHGERREPLPLEIEVEKRGLERRSPPKGVIYDGWEFMRYIRSLLPSHSISRLHILITTRLLSTEEGGIHHIRAILLGYPCIISTSGLVEGPAKPRKFYLFRRLGNEELYRAVEEDNSLRHDDPRLPLVLRGYTLQALFYHATGNPFCKDKGCCLYNAHWQDELIYAQLESPYELCPFHEKLLEELKKGNG
jgi:hypothetical protein